MLTGIGAAYALGERLSDPFALGLPERGENRHLNKSITAQSRPSEPCGGYCNKKKETTFKNGACEGHIQSHQRGGSLSLVNSKADK